MNQKEFMDKLGYELAALPENERNELLRRCEECFRVGLLQGKTEERIAFELSRPSDTAEPHGYGEESYGQSGRMSGNDPRFARADHSYEGGRGYGPGSEPLPWPPAPPPAWSPPPRPKPRRDVARFIGVGILLLFLNAALAIPVVASLWAVFVSLCASAVGMLLSPVALALETALYGDFATPKLLLALGAVGIGMLLAGLSFLIGKWLWRATRSYVVWNYKTLKGSPSP